MEETNVTIVTGDVDVKDNKVKTFFVEHKKKIFTGLGVVGAFVLGAIAHSKWTEDDEEGNSLFGGDDKGCCDCETCTCGENDDVTED